VKDQFATLVQEPYRKYADEVVHALNEITDETVKSKGNRDWTLAVKHKLGELGEQNGFSTCASGCRDREYDAEWLYDLVWYKNNFNDGKGHDRRLTEVPLVMEIEWSPDFLQIRYDFEKLLVANAPIKAMVFWNENAFEGLEDGIKKYKNGVASIYILACYVGEKVPAFNIRTFKTDDTGRITEFTGQ